MPPRKRKATTESEPAPVQAALTVDPNALQAIQERLRAIDAAGALLQFYLLLCLAPQQPMPACIA
jgi:hypothetical protein